MHQATPHTALAANPRGFSRRAKGAGARRLLWLIAAALGLVLAPVHAPAVEALRVCAEPDNLPFSQRAGPRKGLYLELADALGKALDRPVSYVWIEGWGMGGVKAAFTQQQCDVYFGLPANSGFNAPYLSLTRPFARESYALVLPKGAAVRSFADLAGKHVAVQYGTPPQMLLAVNNVDMLTCDTVPEAMAAMARHETDAAFLWGPAAGYYNKDTLRDAYQVLPTSGRGLDWAVAIGVRKDEPELRDALDRQLGGLRSLIGRLEKAYGFPMAAPVSLARTATEKADVRLASAGGGWSSGASRYQAVGPKFAAADTSGSATDAPSTSGWPADARSENVPLTSALPAHAQSRLLRDASVGPGRAAVRQATDSRLAAQAAGDGSGKRAAAMEPRAAEGRDIFNSRCAHCHGDDAITGNTERSIPDLLRKIPPAQMEAFFLTVVTNGEPDQGMPPWGDALSEEQKKKIFAFIRWRQEHPPKD